MNRLALDDAAMTEDTKIQFTRRYGAALQRHLRQRPRGRLAPRSARSLGRAAMSFGLDPLDLARVHDWTTVRAEIPIRGNHGGTDS